MKNKIFLYPLSLAVILFASFIIIFSPLGSKTLIPIPTPTPAEWQTYKNDQYGFEFQYPLDYKLEYGRLITPDNNQIDVKIFFDTSKTIEEFLTVQDKISATAWEGQPSKTIRTTQKTQINGYNVIKREEFLLAADSTNYVTYFKISNSNFISLSLFNVPGSVITNDKSIYQQILSTFKILPYTSVWKTYENDTYGFKFQYPPYFLPDNFIHITPLTYKGVVQQHNEKLLSESLIKIGNQSIYRFKTTGGEVDVNYLYFTRQNKNILIDIYYEDSVTNQILSTFKFTNSSPNKYTCPTSGWADCLPGGPNVGVKFECTSEALNWYKLNCPDFKGAAL